MRWIGVVNCALAGTILFVVTLFVFLREEEEYVPIVARPESKELPKSPFADTEEFFQEIGDSLFCLNWVAPQMQLPDLRQELIFSGKNGRPDSLPGKAFFHFSLKGSQERLFVRECERTYLVYQGNYSPKELRSAFALEQCSSSCSPLWGETPPKQEAAADKASYVFSPGNQPTPLWFEVKSMGDQAVEVRVSMLDEKGALVQSPLNLRSFPLHLQEVSKTQVAGWDLGGYRVDSTLLVRQKARWVGIDVFLMQHGGEEFSSMLGKERIDFLDGPSPYSCFVTAGDFLAWKNGRWEVVETLEESQNLPLLVVKKIDDKILTFELWDPEGKGKTTLSLIRIKDHNGMPNLSQEFKFVGAKTWAQFIVESRKGERMTLKPHDWLVLTPDGWKKLDTPDLVDAYVNHTLTGPLFILEKMTKQNGRQVLIGHLFNASRTEVEAVELTSSPSTPLANFYRQLPITPPIQPKPILLEMEGGE